MSWAFFSCVRSPALRVRCSILGLVLFGSAPTLLQFSSRPLLFKQSEKLCVNGTLLQHVDIDLTRSVFCSSRYAAYILIGDSTLRNKYDFATDQPVGRKHKWNAHCQRMPCDSTICYVKVELVSQTAVQRAVSKLPTHVISSPWKIIVVNFGLHQLHFYPLRPKFLKSTYNFTSELDSVLSWLLAFSPAGTTGTDSAVNSTNATGTGITKVFAKLTNSICTSLYNDIFATTLENWYIQPAVRGACQQKCLVSKLQIEAQECTEYCNRFFFDDFGVRELNTHTMTVLSKFPEIRVLDDYALTHGQCECSRMGDGRHYHALIPLWWAKFIDVLSQDLMTSRLPDVE